MWMLLHGFMGSARSWDSLTTLGRFDDPPSCPPLLGHGDDWRVRRVETFAGEVNRLVAEVESMSSPRFLCGYSMGARVALGVLASRRVDIAGAVLIGVHPGLETLDARAERRCVDAARIARLREEGVRPFVDAWESEPLFASQRALSDATLGAQRDIRLAHDAAGLIASLEVLGLAEMPNYADALRSLLNVVLVAGSLDHKFASIARRTEAQTPPVIIEGVGHNVLLEAPAAIAEIMGAMERGHGRS